MEVQEDFSIKIEGYPLLKKFTNPERFGSNEFFETIQRIGVNDDGFLLEIKVSLCDQGIKFQPIFENIQDQNKYETASEEDISILHDYINNQLSTSGVLPEVNSLLMMETSCILITVATREIDIDEYQIMSEKVIEDGEQIHTVTFHQDSDMFVMINYIGRGDIPVLGTEILFTNMVGDHSARIRGEVPRYNINQGRVASIQESINELYARDGDIINTTLRGLYNSGSTLLWSDMLVRHSQPNPGEKIDEKLLTIHISQNEYITDKVICVNRIPTLYKHLGDRRIIVISISNTVDSIAYRNHKNTRGVF
jgi:hypothetical protein